MEFLAIPEDIEKSLFLSLINPPLAYIN